MLHQTADEREDEMRKKGGGGGRRKSQVARVAERIQAKAETRGLAEEGGRDLGGRWGIWG